MGVAVSKMKGTETSLSRLALKHPCAICNGRDCLPMRSQKDGGSRDREGGGFVNFLYKTSLQTMCLLQGLREDDAHWNSTLERASKKYLEQETLFKLLIITGGGYF